MSTTKDSGKTGGTGNSNSKTSSTSNPAGGTNGTTESGKQIKEISESNLVDSPKFVAINVESGQAGEVPAPKRKYKKREKKEEKKESLTSSKDVQLLIDGIFTVVSLKGGEHWKLSKIESEQIAQPLTNILEKHNLLEKVGNISDGMALVIATISIVIPRILISKMQKPTNKKVEVLKKDGAIRPNGTDTGEKNDKGNSNVTLPNNVGNGTRGNKPNDNEFIKAVSPSIYG